MLSEKDGLFKIFDYSKFYSSKHKDDALNILCDSFNKNEEVAGLLKHVGGDSNDGIDYSTTFIFGVLCLTKLLLNNLCGCVDLQFKKEGMIRKTILNGIPFGGEVKKRIEKLPLETTAKDISDCFIAKDNSVRGIRFHSNSKSKYDPYGGIYINYRKISSILYILEKVGSDDCSLKIIQNAIKEINEVLDTMKNNQRVGIIFREICMDACIAEYNAKVKEEVIKELKEAGAMEDNTQTLTLNRPKQQENKLLTVGNKKAYQVGKGDYKHRNGVIKEEKAEMNKVYTYPVGDKNILADLEDLLNNIIDNPDTVDKLVNYLAKNSPAAHFISEMIGCGEIDDEESLIGALNKATSVSQGMVAAGKNVHIQGGEYKVYNYLNVDYPKPIFGREFSLKQLSFCFDVAAREIEDIFVKAKAEEEAEEQEEEKEEVITHDAVQEHAEEDCEEYPADLEELQKLLEERRKKEAELDAEIKQAEEEERRKALIEELIAANNRIKEKEARLAQLKEK